jgi:hypothetical protein
MWNWTLLDAPLARRSGRSARAVWPRCTPTPGRRRAPSNVAGCCTDSLTASTARCRRSTMRRCGGRRSRRPLTRALPADGEGVADLRPGGAVGPLARDLLRDRVLDVVQGLAGGVTVESQSVELGALAFRARKLGGRRRRRGATEASDGAGPSERGARCRRGRNLTVEDVRECSPLLPLLPESLALAHVALPTQVPRCAANRCAGVERTCVPRGRLIATAAEASSEPGPDARWVRRSGGTPLPPRGKRGAVDV